MFGRLSIVSVIATLLLQLSVFSAEAAVWTTRFNWSPQWESQYNQWVATNWDKDFFVRKGPYRGLLVDCADTVYSMRIIFAAEHGLPFVMKDPTGSGVISNEMTRWDSLPQSERVKKFLGFIYNVGSTASLPNDTYPAAVNRRAINSGSIILTDSRNHHSWTIKYISESGIPFLLFSSRPAKSGMYERFEHPTRDFIFVDGLRPERHAGYRNFRQPQDVTKPVWQVPGYSLEQYKLPWKTWTKSLQERLMTRQESGAERMSRVLGEACRGARERVEFVGDALQAMARIGGRCMTAQEFDDFSTPSRDKRLKGSFEAVLAAYNELGGSLSGSLRQQVLSVVGRDVTSNAYCPVQVSQSQVLSLGQIYQRSMNGMLSSNPHDSWAARWGLESFPGERARRCPVY